MLAAVLDREGYEVAIGDSNALRSPEEQVIEDIKDEVKKYGEYDFYGFGGLITTYTWQKNMIKRIKKEFPDVPILVGGGCFSSIPNEMLKWIPEISVGAFGEGEETIIDLVKHYDKEAKQFMNLQEVKGIYYNEDKATTGSNPIGRKKKVYRTQPRPLIEDLDTLPYPAWEMLPLEEYFRWSPIPLSPEAMRCFRRIDVISERGCPNNCSFCYHWLSDKEHPVRFNSPKYVVEMLKKLRIKYAIDFISFLDENMLCNESRVREFCELMENDGLNEVIKWGCLGDVRHANLDFLKILRRAGCTYISYGGESANQRMLDAMKKGTTVKQNQKAIQYTAQANINPVMTFIFGYPGETIESIIDTTKFWSDNGITCDAFLIQPYPGTELYNQVKSKILEQYNGNLEEWVSKLADATEFNINLSDFTTPELLGLKELARQRNIKELERFAQLQGKK